ncbi:MAG: dienelactone hydrolase family protein [Xanthomonadaceae bacterium]|nr:dienelactone hydrolase family protein [Xanthomonadaceae bacterium]
MPRLMLLVVHEWWGHNDYARKRAEMLAELGYTALALDMYGDGKVADHPDDAEADRDSWGRTQQFFDRIFSATGASED